MQNQRLTINNILYEVVDSMQNFRAEDSFVSNLNKLKKNKGAGEAKKYVGNFFTGFDGLKNFFEYSNWGKQIKVPNKKVKKNDFNTIQDQKCFFSKSNLLLYLADAKDEYYYQEQIYRQNIKPFFKINFDKVNNLTNEVNFFDMYEVSHSKEKSNRAYIRSDNNIWKLWRDIVLPMISYLSILKLKKVDSDDVSSYFYFRIFLDYQFRAIQHPKSTINKDQNRKLDVEVWNQNSYKKTARDPKFREGVLNYMPQCPFTNVSDERVLIASHIKPFQKCIDDNDSVGANDKLNGLTLSPTYDYLFDQGYITFLDDGTLICGTRLSPFTWSRLNINPASKKKLDIKPRGREKYLDYHRKLVFQDNIEELV